MAFARAVASAPARHVAPRRPRRFPAHEALAGLLKGPSRAGCVATRRRRPLRAGGLLTARPASSQRGRRPFLRQAAVVPEGKGVVWRVLVMALQRQGKETNQTYGYRHVGAQRDFTSGSAVLWGVGHRSRAACQVVSLGLRLAYARKSKVDDNVFSL